jgi:hypothetical protein
VVVSAIALLLNVSGLELATAFHELVARLLAERVVHANASVAALLH